MTALALTRNALGETRRRELILCAGLAGLVALVLHLYGPPPGDAEVHLYRTFLVRHGTLLWDNFWYEGDFPLTSYSLLYYLPAAITGNLPLVMAAVVVSAALFASIAHREWGGIARWPARAFGAFAAAPLFTGLFSYAIGLTALLATICALQARRTLLALVFAALTLGFSPLAFAFLVLVLASVALARRRLSRTALAVAAGLGVLGGFELLVIRIFPAPGIYPFHLVNLAGVLGVCLVGALLARRTTAAAPLLAFFVLWGLTSLVASAVASPIGGNWTRLNELVFPLMLLTAMLARFRPVPLTVVALTGALAYSLIPHLLLVPYRLDSRPAGLAFWRPALHFLRVHDRPGFRVEVVPTAAHWEAYWVPRSGYPIARGWYRQLDEVDNPSLYAATLDAASYERWLRSVAVRYVLLPATKLDPVGGPAEARILRSHPPGLRVVARTRNWTIFELERPSPLLTGPGRVDLTLFGHERIAGSVSRPGTYLLRVHYLPFWDASPGVCTTRGPNGMTFVSIASAGSFSLRVADAVEVLARVAEGPGGCGAPAADGHATGS